MLKIFLTGILYNRFQGTAKGSAVTICHPPPNLPPVGTYLPEVSIIDLYQDGEELIRARLTYNKGVAPLQHLVDWVVSG